MSATVENKTICVYGAGHQGLSMAAHLALNGVKVNLYNRTQAHIQKVMDTSSVLCNGIICGEAKLNKVSADIAETVTDIIMVTTPSSAHKDAAKTLAPFVDESTVIILNPGRTFGAIEFAEELIKNGASSLPHIAETQTIVYTCRKSAENSTSIFALKNDVKIAALKTSDIETVMQAIPQCLKGYFTLVDSVALTSFSNIGMVLHCAPVLMNIGWIESDKTDFKYYYDGISPSIAHFLEKIDQERIAIAKAAGYEVESLKEWLERTYQVQGDDIFECIKKNETYREIDAPPSLHTRYLFEDIPNGMVPLEYIGTQLGVNTKNISTIIDLAEAVLDTDYREMGRRFDCEVLKQYF